jgi:hypothetical protein
MKKARPRRERVDDFMLLALFNTFGVSPPPIKGETQFRKKEIDAIKSVLDSLTPEERDSLMVASAREYLNDSGGERDGWEAAGPWIAPAQWPELKLRARKHFRQFMAGPGVG